MDVNLQEILDYSKNSKSDLDIAAIDANDLFGGCLKEMSHILPEEKFGFNLDVQGESPFFSDEQRVKVIFCNFLSNALHFRDTSKERLTVDVLMETTPTTVTFSVSDNGLGIAPEHQDKIFNMFYRATESTNGSGLGLFVAKEVVEKLGGYISVQSEPGKGSTFTATIPNRIDVSVEAIAC
jgi:signal transduction histidine kinase